MTDPATLPYVLTVPEAAELLRLDVRTVRDMFHRKQIEGNRHGTAIRLLRDSVLDWARGKCAPHRRSA